MAKVESVKDFQIEPVTTFKDMECGDLAEVLSDKECQVEYVSRSGNRIISLRDCEDSWINYEDNTMPIRILDKGEQIILTQER